MSQLLSLVLRRTSPLEKTLLNGNALLNNGLKRGIAATSTRYAKKMPDKPKPPPENEFTEVFLHGSGPGGQKINKTSSAVQLKHLPTGLVVKVQATRSRTQNRKLARQMLADRLDDREKGDLSRSKVKGEVKKRKKASAGKKARRKYRKLEEDGEGEEGSVKEMVEGVERGIDGQTLDGKTEEKDEGQK